MTMEEMAFACGFSKSYVTMLEYDDLFDTKTINGNVHETCCKFGDENAERLILIQAKK